jgi:hypothetical protein
MQSFIYYTLLIDMGALFLSYCKVCKQEMKQIPIRKIDSLIILEEYCPNCDESIIRYENIQLS